MKRTTPLRRVGKKGRRDAAELKRVKAEVLLRSRGRCEAWEFSPLCTHYGVVTHHIVRRSQGGTNDPENLLWACVPCHDRIHAAPAEALTRGFLKPGGEAA